GNAVSENGGLERDEPENASTHHIASCEASMSDPDDGATGGSVVTAGGCGPPSRLFGPVRGMEGWPALSLRWPLPERVRGNVKCRSAPSSGPSTLSQNHSGPRGWSASSCLRR